jgi:predicted ArsR family transcriptional regulator
MKTLPIFQALKLQPTPVRTLTLKIVLAQSEKEFTIDQICEAVCEAQQLTVNGTSGTFRIRKTGIVNTLRLLVTRGLIVQSGQIKSPGRGRPELVFRVSEAFREAGDTRNG